MIPLLLAISTAVNLASPIWKPQDLDCTCYYQYIYEPEFYKDFYPDSYAVEGSSGDRIVVPDHSEVYHYGEAERYFYAPLWPLSVVLPDETYISVDIIKDVKTITLESSTKPRLKKEGNYWVITYK